MCSHTSTPPLGGGKEDFLGEVGLNPEVASEWKGDRNTCEKSPDVGVCMAPAEWVSYGNYEQITWVRESRDNAGRGRPRLRFAPAG